MPHIISLNGPAGSGKDTIAYHLNKHYGFEKLEFKDGIFAVACEVLGANYSEFLGLYHNREAKEKPSEMLGGLSPRQFFIRISEEWIKPTFGKEYFADRLIQKAKVVMSRDSNPLWGNPGASASGGNRHVVISDGGFEEESAAVFAAFPQFQVVRLHRCGFDFCGDSRSYVYGVPGFDLHLQEGEPKAAAEFIYNKLNGVI